MFLKHKRDGVLIEVLTMDDLYDPCVGTLMGCAHAGEELQDPITYPKTELIFPSGEPLPQCWLDVHYQTKAIHPLAEHFH
jgi:hypothetical protein